MRLKRNQYLDHVRTDGFRLVDVAAEHMDDPAPWCPGWVGRDVVGHAGVVHRHKLAIVAGELQANPEPETPPDGDDALLSWYREGLTALLTALESAESASRVYTWHPPDLTVGFWIRRMAHETAIHRGDAESTAGPITPLDPTLAADGVDEVLGPIMCAYTTDPSYEFASDGRTVELRMSDINEVRHLMLGSGKYGNGWLYGMGPAPDPVAVISATASDLDLWSWGRADQSVLTIGGDPSVVAGIRAVAAEATR